MVEGRRVSAVQRHSQQPADEVHAGRGAFRLPGADQPGQRPHPRPVGAAAGLRAPVPAGDQGGTGREHYGGCQQLPGRTPEPSQRRYLQVRRQHLLHRSWLSHPGVGPRLQRRVPGVAGPGDHHPDSLGLRPSQRAGLLAGRKGVVHQRQPAPDHPGFRRRAQRDARPGLRPAVCRPVWGSSG